jgi:hypothetical protein
MSKRAKSIEARKNASAIAEANRLIQQALDAAEFNRRHRNIAAQQPIASAAGEASDTPNSIKGVK